MPFVPHVLIVEDDPRTIANWKLLFEEPGGGVAFQPTFVTTMAAALEVLATHRIDAAVIDLRLGNEPNEDGLEVLKAFSRMAVGVAAILTGQASAAMDDYVDQAPRGTLQIFQKGSDGQEEAIRWLRNQVALLEVLRGARTTITEMIAEVFLSSLWPRWQEWLVGSGYDRAKIQAAITRHMAAHVYAVLLESEKHRALNEEWFFVPPVRGGIRTGDLLRTNDGFSIVISPKCDLARLDCPRVNLLKCEPAPEDARSAETRLGEALKAAENARSAHDVAQANSAVEKARNRVRDYWGGGKVGLGKHFLPSVRLLDGSLIGPLVVDFSSVYTLEIPDALARDALMRTRIAALTPDFLPTLVSRFGAYFSRFGHLDPL